MLWHDADKADIPEQTSANPKRIWWVCWTCSRIAARFEYDQTVSTRPPGWSLSADGVVVCPLCLEAQRQDASNTTEGLC